MHHTKSVQRAYRYFNSAVYSQCVAFRSILPPLCYFSWTSSNFHFLLNHGPHCVCLCSVGAHFMYVSKTLHVICCGQHITGYYCSLPLIPHFSPPLLCCVFDFLFQWWDREEEAAFLLPVNYPSSVSPSSLIGVWETLALSQRAQPGQWRPI